ncbi:GlcG/HbpS family heme-binding protein [Microvirga pudoricolor]|uniref:GlcG/HbpS family heme-binding protein n=1 Tax=Microvirga pudoricolor TaxID=2778729 RepID=UPI001950EC4E|nr:heme-binding protein [Microvirga pudoricolor]MBM6596648.1 heme-binding protein [Microvirga pudoricolor]
MITSKAAQAVITAGLKKATELGVRANIAILDEGAHLKAFVRMDGAVLGSIDLAQGKARTSALFGVTSEAVWDYCKPGAPAPGLERSNSGLMPFPGGIPLTSSDGTLIGAVGVSGGTPAQDADIARAAAEAV